jgi:hypothetical protein
MLGRFFRAGLIFLVAVLLDILLRAFGDPLINDVAEPSNLPASAPPLVQWGQYFVDYFLLLVLLSLIVYLFVGAWIENQATGGL